MNRDILRKRKSKRELSPALTAVIRAAVSFGITAAVSVVLLLAMALVASLSPDPTGLLVPLALVALYLASLIGGAVAAARDPSPIMGAAVNSGVLLLVSVLLSVFDYSSLPSPYGTWTSVLCHLAIVPVSLIGALIIMKKRSGRSSRKRYRR